MELIQQMFMPPWTTGTKILIQFQLHLKAHHNPVLFKTQDQTGHTKVQKDLIQLTTSNITFQVHLQTTTDGTPTPLLSNQNQSQPKIKNTWKIKNGRKIFQSDQIQLIINNTMLEAHNQTCKLIQVTTFLL